MTAFGYAYTATGLAAIFATAGACWTGHKTVGVAIALGAAGVLYVVGEIHDRRRLRKLAEAARREREQRLSPVGVLSNNEMHELYACQIEHNKPLTSGNED